MRLIAVRSQLNKLRVIDLDSIKNMAANLEQELMVLTADPVAADIKDVTSPSKAIALLPSSNSYPKIGDFSLTLLSFGVLQYFYLALPALMVQMLVDFGFPLAVIYAAWAMSRRSEKPPR
jgi:hypothetical protein